MRTFITYNILIVFFMLLNFKYSKAQIPVNDAGWQFQSARSDSFNSGSLDQNKWWTDNIGVNTWAAEIDKKVNLSFTGTSMKIKADTLVPDTLIQPSSWNDTASVGVYYAHQGGNIQSTGVPNAYKFGYLEISAKYPTGKYSDWPAFWLYWNDCTPGSEYYNEIDIAENGGGMSKNGYTVGTGYSVNTSGCTNIAQGTGQTINTSFLLSLGFHKYAIEWAPDRMVWYIDDAAVRTVYDASGANIPQNGLRLVLNFAIDPWNSLRPASPRWDKAYIPCGGSLCAYDTAGTNFPHYFEIDYVNYYKLNTDCSTNLTFSSSTTYDRKVKNQITTDTSNPPTFNPGTAAASYTLRADESVTIDAGVTINPTGTGYFAIDIMPCPQ